MKAKVYEAKLFSRIELTAESVEEAALLARLTLHARSNGTSLNTTFYGDQIKTEVYINNLKEGNQRSHIRNKKS